MPRARLAAALLSLLAAAAQADELGHAAFTGQLAAARPACHRCHMRDGRGGTEGGAPDLVAAAARHDAASLRRALVEGIAADGRPLSRLMPRYPGLDDLTAAALLAYLGDLPIRDRLGVEPALVRLGVAADPAYALALQAALDRTAPRLFGRRLQVVAVVAPGTPQVLAVVGLRAPLQPWTDAGVPVLFPRQTLRGTEDASITRGLSAAAEDIGDAIMADARRAGFAGVEPRGEVDPAIAAVLRRPASGPAALVLGRNADSPPPPARLYALPGAQTERRDAIRVVPGGPLLDRMMVRHIPAHTAHAEIAAEIIAAALRAAGRDLTRTRFLAAMTAADLTALGLDYRRAPLTGTREVGLRIP